MTTTEVFRITNELTIEIPALPRPTLEEVQTKFVWIRSIERDTSPIDAVTLTLTTVLQSTEGSISDKEYERRLAPKHDQLLGFQHAVWLVEHQDEFPDLKPLLGKIYIDFPGIVAVPRLSRRSFPSLYQGDGRWRLRWRWTGYGFNDYGRVAVSHT